VRTEIEPAKKISGGDRISVIEGKTKRGSQLQEGKEDCYRGRGESRPRIYFRREGGYARGRKNAGVRRKVCES